MGRARDKKVKTYTLTEREMNYLRILNLALAYNQLKDKIFSGFLYEVCSLRFGYPEDINLVFEVDLESETNELKVTEVPTEAIKAELDNKRIN